MLTELKNEKTYYQGIAISYFIWRFCDTVYIMFMLTVATQFTTYFILRRKEKDNIRNSEVAYVNETIMN